MFLDLFYIFLDLFLCSLTFFVFFDLLFLCSLTFFMSSLTCFCVPWPFFVFLCLFLCSLACLCVHWPSSVFLVLFFYKPSSFSNWSLPPRPLFLHPKRFLENHLELKRRKENGKAVFLFYCIFYCAMNYIWWDRIYRVPLECECGTVTVHGIYESVTVTSHWVCDNENGYLIINNIQRANRVWRYVHQDIQHPFMRIP